jgi:thiamine-monophosphate kinase
MGELDLIKKFRLESPTHPWIAVGPGQDCAILNWPGERDQAFKIDQVVEGTHFVLSGEGAATPAQVGWKAMAKACSDIAATGFWPVAATVAVNLRKGSNEKIALGVFEGLTECCRRYQFGLAGGDISVSENGLSVIVSLLGEGPKGKAWLRRGAKVGDILMVTGTLGGSQAGRHLSFEPRLNEAREIRRLAPNGVHACIDITDGLSRDLHHICDESDCGAVVFEDKIPCTCETSEKSLSGPNIQNALCVGEDFELLLAVERHAAEYLLEQWRSKVSLTAIGEIVSSSEGRNLLSADGSRRRMPDVVYEHKT